MGRTLPGERLQMMIRIVFLSTRIFLVVLLLSTGIGKLLDIQGFADVIATYQFFIPEILLAPLGLIVALFELFLGLAIGRGIGLKLCAMLTILTHAGYAGLAIITNLRGLELNNCGCFGVFLARPMTWFTVIEDMVLLGLSILFFLCVQHHTVMKSSIDPEETGCS